LFVLRATLLGLRAARPFRKHLGFPRPPIIIIDSNAFLLLRGLESVAVVVAVAVAVAVMVAVAVARFGLSGERCGCFGSVGHFRFNLSTPDGDGGDSTCGFVACADG
jgi:hypothetical protein